MPNYLALFAGSSQGTTHEGCPQTWKTPNVETALSAAKLTFAGYSEGLPRTGYTGCGTGQTAASTIHGSISPMCLLVITVP